MDIELKDLLALLGEKTVQIAILEGQVTDLQRQLDTVKNVQNQAKQAQVPHTVVKSE